MEEFLRTGALGPVRVGMPRAQIQELLGAPDGMYLPTTRRRKGSSLWIYGDIELHFAWEGDELWMIFLEDFEKPSGGRSIELDACVLKGGAPRGKILEALQASAIPYRQLYEPINEAVLVETSGDVQLLFIEKLTEFGPPLGMYGVSRSIDRSLTGIPIEYQLIGTVEHFWDRIGDAGVRLLSTATLERGQRIAFELEKGFEEQDVDSLQVNGHPVQRAGSSLLVGIKTHLTKAQARKGVRVFVVRSSDNEKPSSNDTS